MKISLIGYGKMGKLIEKKALENGHTITAIVDTQSPLTLPKQKDAVAESDVCIDFSAPHCAIEHIKLLANMKKNIVVGTTGWNEQLDEARHIVEKANIGFIHSPNFSLGVALFLHIVEQAAALINPLKIYDVSGVEVHHKQKLDSPSGTARAIAEKINRYKSPSEAPISFSSVRVGNVPGTHTVLFDSEVDSITLTHTARNRDGFALGALTAAEWIRNRQGFFTLKDLMSHKMS